MVGKWEDQDKEGDQEPRGVIIIQDPNKREIFGWQMVAKDQKLSRYEDVRR